MNRYLDGLSSADVAALVLMAFLGGLTFGYVAASVLRAAS